MISEYADAHTVQAHSKCQLFPMQCLPEHWQHIHHYVCYQSYQNEKPSGAEKHRDKELSVLGIMK